MAPCKTVLFVDDEQGILDVYEGFLRPKRATSVQSARMSESAVPQTDPFAEYTFLFASSGEEAVALVEAELAKGGAVTCGFFDMKMPGGMDGLLTIAKIRQLDPRVLVTIVTAHQDRSISELNKQFEPDHQDEWDLLSKPFTKWEVVQTCRQMVASWNRRRREEQLTQHLEQVVDQRTSELIHTNEELNQRHAELQHAQSQLVQSEKMVSVGQLAAGVAHEINNPVGFVHSNLGSLERYLGRIVEYCEAVESSVESLGSAGQGLAADLTELRRRLKVDFILEDLPQLIEQSRDGTERIKNIVLGLKIFSHPGTGQQHEENVNQGLQNTLNLVANELRRRAELLVDLSDIPAVVCNQAELNQVWMNLLMNAGHAVEERETPGQIEVSSWLEGQEVVITVKDDGCGIPEGDVSRIFEPFFTTKEVGKGTGLGLSLAYGIVQRNGGNIVVTSTEGEGTCFTVRFPAVEVAVPAN
jgi:two-component system NtrC family sensor kinase